MESQEIIEHVDELAFFKEFTYGMIKDELDKTPSLSE